MTLPEATYRDLFARQYGAQTEVPVPFGRVDCVLIGHFWSAGIHPGGERYEVQVGMLAVEVEPLITWHHGVRQALAYAAQLTYGEGRGRRKLRPAVAVYGEVSAAQARAMRRKVDRLAELFLLDGVEWSHIEHVAPRRQIYRPARDELILAALVAEVSASA